MHEARSKAQSVCKPKRGSTERQTRVQVKSNAASRTRTKIKVGLGTAKLTPRIKKTTK
jgi:hypothetical protein